MTILYHPSVRKDVREIIDYYDARSDTAGDRFFAEMKAAEMFLTETPAQCHFIGPWHRRLNFKRFPYHLVFDLADDVVRVLVIRHHRRHPDHGMRRRWR